MITGARKEKLKYMRHYEPDFVTSYDRSLSIFNSMHKYENQIIRLYLMLFLLIALQQEEFV